jgi:golgi apparatus protein 1
MLTRAKSIDLMPEIQDKCAADLSERCNNVKVNMKGEELRCLQNNFKDLQVECRQAVANFTAEESKDIRLDQILMKACMPTIEEYCADKREEKGDLLECLISQKNNIKMDEKCKIGIEHHQLLGIEDVSLNYKFKRACQNEINDHCNTGKNKVDVIHCLSEFVLNDTLLEKAHRIGVKCRQQLRFELLQMSENIKFDPELQRSCAGDIENFCDKSKTGDGQVIECLRNKENELSRPCYKMLFKREKINLIDQNSDYALMKKCKNAIQTYCGTFNSQDVISCLRKHLMKPDLELPCRLVLINRIMTQNRDARLNQDLHKACLRDIQMHCKSEFTEMSDPTQDLNGRVLKCLKKEYVNNELSKQCQSEVEQIMREAAAIDIKMDPLLYDACIHEINELCQNEDDQKKENCLKVMFQRKQIKRDSKCYEVCIMYHNKKF